MQTLVRAEIEAKLPKTFFFDQKVFFFVVFWEDFEISKPNFFVIFGFASKNVFSPLKNAIVFRKQF